MGQAFPSPMPGMMPEMPPMPGMQPWMPPMPSMPGMFPGMPPMPSMPGMFPGMPPMPPQSPLQIVTQPSQPQPDAKWLMKFMQPGGGMPPLPGGMPPLPGASSQSGLQDAIKKYQAGVTAFQQLTTVHSIFRTPIMVPHFMSATDEDEYFYQNSDTLKALCDLMLPIPVQQVVDMVGWLQGVNSQTSYPPDQWILLVKKLILNQKISFPTIELPYRIINFISRALRTTVTGPQEKIIRTQQDAARKKLYAAIDAVSQAQANFTLAVKEANTPANVADPVAWANSILAQAGSTQAMGIVLAQKALDDAKASMNQVQDQIHALSEQMAALNNTVLNSDQLAQFLIQNLPASIERDQLRDSYNRIESTIALSHSLMQPILDQENQVMAQMSPFRARRAAASSAFFAARAPINSAANTHQSPTQAQIDAFNAAQDEMNAAMAAIQPYTDQMTALNNQMQKVWSDHPEFLVKGKSIADESVISDLCNQALNQAALDMPSDLMSIVQSAMQTDAKAADDRSKELQIEKAEMIQAKSEAFQQFYQDKVEAELQFYRDQLKLAQDGYNGVMAEIKALADKAQSIQDEISANITELGGVIGWWCHVNNISDSAMASPQFISQALNALVALQGKFDKVEIPTMLGMSSTQVFWTGEGHSSDMAGQTLTQMGNLETAKVNYAMQSPPLIAQLKQITDWMQQVQQAFQITSERVNSKEYAQALLPEFNASPQGALLQSDIDAITNPLRQITLSVQADQHVMESLLHDLEKEVLATHGCDLSEISSLSYEQKKHLWIGVCDHLKGPGQRLAELQGYINDMSARLQAGKPLEGDPENIQAAKVALMNIIAAQNIQRRLENDISFMSALHDDAKADTTTAVQNAQTAHATATQMQGGVR